MRPKNITQTHFHPRVSGESLRQEKRLRRREKVGHNRTSYHLYGENGLALLLQKWIRFKNRYLSEMKKDEFLRDKIETRVASNKTSWRKI